MKVFYFDIDTLRYDHLSCYGYELSTPHMDALAADGVRFTQAYASNTPCMPSRAALFTGCFGVINGVETHGRSALEVATPEHTALPRVLTEHGVQAVTVSSFGRHPAPWFYNGFSHVMDPSYLCKAENFQRFDGQEVNRAAQDFLDGFKGTDLFMHLHYWDPHGPLTPPSEWIDEQYEPDTSQITDEQIAQLSASPLYRGGKHMKVHDRNDLARLLRLYDAEVRYADHLVGQMIDYLKERGWYEDAVILLSADHGEQYGEGQMILEHGTVDESCIHIPLLLKAPGVPAGVACNAPVYGLDVAPTVVRCFGVQAPSLWNGTALQDTLNGVVPARDYLVCEHGLYTCQRAVLKDRWKMVHTFSAGLWDFPEYALYDRSEGPSGKDRKEEFPDVLKQMQQTEKEWLAQTIGDAPDVLALLGQQNGQHGMRVAREVTLRMEQGGD